MGVSDLKLPLQYFAAATDKTPSRESWNEMVRKASDEELSKLE
jgi:hypothetical protein